MNIKIRKNVPLAPLTTFKIGGPAKLFIEATTNKELLEAVKYCRLEKIPFFLLGNGSNLLVSDKGFKGMVIKVKTFGCRVERETLFAQAGTPTAFVLKTALKNNLTGLEFLKGIPGTIGGAVIGNSRAYFLGKFLKNPVCLADVIRIIKVLTPEGEIKSYPARHYPYSLSESAIKESGDIVLGVKLKLKKGVSQKAKQYLRDYHQYRLDKPYQKYPTPGSIFQNPPGQSAGQLIDQCGLKGKKIGRAQISPEHANFIINLGRAKAKDILALIKLAKKAVKQKFALDLKEEIVLVGF